MTSSTLPTIPKNDLNLAEMQQQLQDAGAIDKNDTLYLGEIIKKTAGKDKNGKVFAKFQMLLDGDENRGFWNQFNGLESTSVSGQILRSYRTVWRKDQDGNDYDSGELEDPSDSLVVWAGQITPNPGNTPWQNINQLITKVVATEPASGTEGLTQQQKVDDLFQGASGGNISNLRESGDKLMEDIQRNQEPQTVLPPRYLPLNDVRSISIERQVAVKSATDMTILRGELAKVVLTNMPLVGVESTKSMIETLDAIWAWVCFDVNHKNTGITDRAKELANWLEFNI